MAADVPSPEVWESGPYLVRHHRRSTERLIIVFTGAAFGLANTRDEEFRQTLSGLDVSMCFVRDEAPRWLDHDETPAALAHVADIASRYPHVGAMGESMGGSCAIVFSGQCPSVRRVLAFVPQFSMSKPVIQADERFSTFGERFPEQRFRTFDAPGRPHETLVLYGTEEATDLVHAGLYAVYGYELGFVDGANHQLAMHLKYRPEGNLLVDLAARFADFSHPFGYAAAAEVLGSRLSRRMHSRDRGFDAERLWLARSTAARTERRQLPPPEGLDDLCRGGTTDQSSVSRWSRGGTAEDSARAVSGRPTGRFAFHTEAEERPWWSIDFGRDVVVGLVRIYNRMSTLADSERGLAFAIETAVEDGDWREVYRKADAKLFGGADGTPFAWSPDPGVPARRLRIRLLGQGPMHYDQIEIFGLMAADRNSTARNVDR